MLTFVVWLVLAGATAEVEGRFIEFDNDTCEVNNCTECYDLLVYNVLKLDINRYNMQRIFFPPGKANPLYVIVYYRYTGEENEMNNESIWFWTEYTFYNYQPIPVLQFTSLFFTDPNFRVSELDITLDGECRNASIEYMQLLTQRVRINYLCSYNVCTSHN